MAEHNQVTTQSLPELTPEVYINRELSTIEFQRRVLAQAKDPDIPLLERLKFIAIVGTNLDEFFMVRVASYLQKVRLGINTTRPDGYMPAQLLQAIRSGVDSLLRDHRRTKRELFKQLEAEGVYILSVQELSKTEQNVVQAYFKETIFPVLTPLAADHARPFPFISNLSLNLGVFLEREDSGAVEFARIKVPAPDILPRLVNLNDLMRNYDVQDSDNIHYVWIEDVIQNNLHSLFPGMRIIESYPFRVLRNADIDYEHEQEEELRDVMSFIEKGVRERRFGSVVRVSVPKNISDRMLKRLRDGLEVHQQAYVYQIDGTVGSADLFELTAIDRPDLKYPSYVPKTPNFLQSEADIWSAIRKQDRIIHHPYETFAPVEEFFRAAANDPNVLAIKATLYRVGKNSPVVQALMDARDNNKQVTVLVELKARFDEENNLTWARAMEEKEVHVIYGVEELAVKTHAKVALVVRREEDGVRRYLHLGTGNYNSSTARLYTDLGLFTCDETLCNDASRLFNRLTGYAPNTSYEKLFVAPDYLFDEIYSLIDNEIQAARAGKDARLIFKMNQLEEDRIIQKLYEASQAGVKVDLMVRGFCCLRPGVAGVSDNIRVTSVIGRYLEHSRAYYFQNAPDEKQLLLGSADLMRRNLYNRVEVVFPVLDSRTRLRVMRTLATELLDNQGAWELLPDGTYHKIDAQDGEIPINAQQIFMQDSFGLDILP
ncbi:MAG: polyphosphate kinase 1 [Anaerolineae bacterium]|nr:polyphosphate kinase 1 [Anaerolineae bacterium]